MVVDVIMTSWILSARIGRTPRRLAQSSVETGEDARQQERISTTSFAKETQTLQHAETELNCERWVMLQQSTAQSKALSFSKALERPTSAITGLKKILLKAMPSFKTMRFRCLDLR